jgi:hypothetical protein
MESSNWDPIPVAASDIALTFESVKNAAMDAGTMSSKI